MKYKPELGLTKRALHNNPDYILEAAYSNPTLRRWHRRTGVGDPQEIEKDINWWKHLVRRAGRDDAYSLLHAMSSETIGFHPDDYGWEWYSDGTYHEGKEYIKIGDEAKKLYGTTDPAIVIPKIFGAVNPEQLALRYTGVASPFLRPEVTGIAVAADSDRNGLLTAGIRIVLNDDPWASHITVAHEIPEDPDAEPGASWLGYMYLPTDKLGRGLGLAAYSAIQNQAQGVGSLSMDLMAQSVGTYMWPLLGFDSADPEDLASTEQEAINILIGDVGLDKDKAAKIVDNYDPDGLPDMARFRYGDRHVGQEALMSHWAFPHLSKGVYDNDYLDEVVRRRVEALEGEQA